MYLVTNCLIFLLLWTGVLALKLDSSTRRTVREAKYQIQGVNIVSHKDSREKRQASYPTPPVYRPPPIFYAQQPPRQQLPVFNHPQSQVNPFYQQAQLPVSQPQQIPPPRHVVASDYQTNPQPLPVGPYVRPSPGPSSANPAPFGVARYYYPPRQRLPLPKCFHNPTGYVCCNEQLNDLIVSTYTELEARPKFHACNVQALATHLQLRAEKHFNTTFETIAGYEDFAQKIHFKDDLVCKVELGGRYMLAYGTAKGVTESRLPVIQGRTQYGPTNLQNTHLFAI